MNTANQNQKSLEELLAVVHGAESILILPHNNPDPDAIASALALQQLLKEKLGLAGSIAYHGIIGRAENRALLRYLDYPLQPITSLDWSDFVPVALVDTQPGAGNVAIPRQSGVVIVIDHHDHYEPATMAQFTDIRPDLGATSTILFEYLQAAGVEIPTSLTTALFYGIKTNTLGLGRNASQADAAAYFYLQSRIDVEALSRIENAQVPASYFRGFDVALRTARIFDDVVISHLGSMAYPDLTAEMADLLLRLEKAQWVICIGLYEDVLILSVRTGSRDGGARQLIQAMVKAGGSCGGHGTIAGGQVPLQGQNPKHLAEELALRALQYLHPSSDSAGEPLV